jgi:carbohydrate-selective porin OprB
LYKIKLSDNILITPGALLIINPENNDKNGKELVGTLRTTFTF